MTYRHDSDIINRYPFGSMSPTKKKQAHYGFAPSNSELLKSSFNRKKKFMAYMKTGECGDPDVADSILAELGKYIKIDIYDKCKKKKDELRYRRRVQQDDAHGLQVRPGSGTIAMPRLCW